MKRPIVNLFMVIMIVVSLIASGIPVTAVEALGAMADVPLNLPGGWNNARLNDIWGSSSSDIYLVGAGASAASGPSQPLIYHYTSGNWVTITPALPAGFGSASLQGVWGDGVTVYAVGSGKETVSGKDWPLFYSTTNGTVWSPTTFEPPPGWTNGSFEAVWGSGPNDIYAVGTGDTGSTKKALIYHYTAAGWSYTIPYPDLATVSLHGVWGSGSGDVYAVGDVGTAPLMLHGSGTNWTRISVGLPLGWNTGSLNGVWGASASEIYVAGNGDNGTKIAPLLLRSSGTTWATYAPPLPSSAWTYGRLYDIWGASSGPSTYDVYAVGSGYNGSTDVPLLYYRRTSGGTWAPSTPLPGGWTQAGYRGLWGTNNDNVYAVGDGNVPAKPFLSHAGPNPDSVAPGAVANLTATPGASSGSIVLSWTAPADDGSDPLDYNLGAVDSYIVQYSTSVLTDCSGGTTVTSGLPTPVAPGNIQTMTIPGLTVGTIYYFSVCARDEEGLQSTAATTSATPRTDVYDDANGAWNYFGTWKTTTGSSFYNSTLHYSTAVGSYATITISDSKFALLYTQFSSRGVMDVYEGTRKLGTITQTGGTVYQQIWVSPDLGPGTHTLKFVYVSGPSIDIDALRIYGALIPSATPYDDTYPSWSYTGSWPMTTGGSFYNSTLHYSTTPNSYATVTIAGGKFTLYYTQFSSRGVLYVYDGTTQIGTITQTGSTVFQKTWTSPGLGPGNHTIKFLYASGASVDIDAIQVSVSLDSIAPAAITNVSAATGATTGSVDLSWTAPGDDNASGTATNYLVRYSTSAINSEATWGTATPVTTGIPAPLVAGTTQTMTVSGLTPGATYYFAVRAQDEEGNTGGLSNVISASAQTPTPLLPSATPYDDTDPTWSYVGSWPTTTGGSFYNSTLHYSTTLNSYATVNITGSQFVLYYTQFSSRGVLYVYDGTTQIGTITQTGSTVYQSTWTSPTLVGGGTHTIKFVYANGPSVDIDAIRVLP